MAGRAGLVYDDQERVGIAVDEDIPYLLEMTRRFALCHSSCRLRL